MNGAEAIVKCLKSEGVEIVFGYSGVAIDPFWNALKDSGIKGVLVRTEQNAGHAASGYARVSEKVGVCAVTSGPGATNLLTGIATAYADSIPLVCITGQVETSQIGSDVFQEADVIGAAESFVKYSFLVKDVRDLPRVFHEAFYIAGSGRKGPVLIDVPQDVQEASIRDFTYPESDPALRTYKPTVRGHIVQIRKVAKELEKAKRPLVCCGGGIHLSGAGEEFRAFVEKFRLPVVWTMMGLGVLPTEHEMGLGMVGNNGHSNANRAMRECDLLIMMGARVADRAVADPDLTFDGKVLVHIDVDPAEIGKNVGPTIPIVGDVKHILADLLDMDIKCRPHEDWIAALYEYRSERRTLSQAAKGKSGFVDAPKFVALLSSMLKEDAVYVADVGQNQIISCLNCEIRKGRFLTSGGMGTMGYSIPAALGAKKADPERQVVAVCGDGAFQMSMMELALIHQEKLPIKIVVVKNSYLGLVREHQKKTYPGDYTMVALGDEPDLKHIAAAYGIDWFLASEMKGLKERIKKFLDSEDGALLEVRIDPMVDIK
ncbi:MAG: biosynthetic-type acetolactate synthase large subunit [Lachnospiraceae bacterium]|nr:biosynthetic-type acetolactate synthase large subunit [Lachnospiraceae bacterium]